MGEGACDILGVRESSPLDQIKPSFKQSPSRCPFCHDDVTPEASVVCQECLARHHQPCWSEGGRCASCSSTHVMQAVKPPLSWEVAYSILAERGYERAAVDRALRGAGRTSEPGAGSLARSAGRLWGRAGVRRGVLCFAFVPGLLALAAFLCAWAYNDWVEHIASWVMPITAGGFLAGVILGVLAWVVLSLQGSRAG